MNEIELAKFADEIEGEFRQEPDTFILHYKEGVSEHEAELVTEELRRRGVGALVMPLTDGNLKPVMQWLGLNE